MKSIIILFSFLAFATAPMSSVINWANTNYEFGAIEQNIPVTASYELTNDGDEPLLITSVKGSCGCTSTDFDGDAILPGKTSTIKATFNAKKVGKFVKTVTVKTNADDQATVLKFSGEVLASK